MGADHAGLSYELALLLGETGQSGRALEWMQETVRRDPDFGRAWYNLGLLHSQAGRAQDALVALAKASDLMPADADAPYAMATILAQAGNVVAAHRACQLALERNPQHPQAPPPPSAA
jgi:Flp pilus assembly protein TadD